MKHILALALAALVILPPAMAVAEPIPLTIDAATPQQVDALDERLKALAATVEAMDDVRGDLTAVRADLATLAADVAALRSDVSALTETVGQHTGAMADNAAAVADIEAKLTDIESRVIDLEARLKPDPGGGGIARTPTELRVLAAVAPLLAHNTPGPDRVECSKEWPCICDFENNPQCEGRPFVYGSILQADRGWKNWRSKGIAIVPGVHSMRRIGIYTDSRPKTNKENFARHATLIRAQDKTAFTEVDCRDGWPRGGDFCWQHTGDFVQTFEGFRICGALGRNRQANLGARSNKDARLVLIGMTLCEADNGIRTTGRWVAMFDTRLFGNANSDRAHGAYISNDNTRGKACPAVVAVDVVSTGNRLAHGFATRCANVYIKGGVYESANGFCIDNKEGGDALIEGITCLKPPGSQWVAIAHGRDKSNPDGTPAKNYTQAHLCRHKGRMVLRDVTVKVTRRTGAEMWLHPFACDGGEIINLTKEGAAGASGPWRNL